MTTSSAIVGEALEWFKGLIRIDTSNPPGGEDPAIDFVAKVLSQHNIQFQIVRSPAGRPNLVAEVSGAGSKPPLLLSSHLDVVPVEDSTQWTHPPFSAVEKEGEIWGRGAVDVKYKAAFDMAALIAAKTSKSRRTIKAAFVADEERGGNEGSRFLVEKHQDLIKAEYVINEVGGFNVQIGARNFVPVQLGEKSFAHLRLRSRGMATHASLPGSSDAIPALAQAIALLSGGYPGFRLTKVSRLFFKAIAENQPEPVAALLHDLMKSSRFQKALSQFPDPLLAAQLRGMLTTTVTATQIQGGFKVNVIPAEATAECDCRIMPEVPEDEFLLGVDEFLREELGELANAISIERIDFCKGYEISPADALFKKIKIAVEEHWSTALPGVSVVPMLMPASSDSSNYIQAGIKPIGFAPLLFPKGFPGFALAHSANERLPRSAFEAGLSCYLQVLQKIAFE